MIASAIALPVDGRDSLDSDSFCRIWLGRTRNSVQFDEAWRCIDETMQQSETTGESWCEAEIHRTAGEIALVSAERGRGQSANLFRTRARNRPRATGSLLGASRGDEPRAALARSGPTRRGP